MELKQVMGGAVKGAFLLLVLFTIACQGVQKTVKPEDRIALLEGGPHSGTYESQTISLDYQYYKQADEIRLNVRAKVETKARYAGLKVWTLFVDSQGKILAEKSIYSWENTFTIPPGTTDLAFRTFLEPVVYKPPMSR